MTRSEAGRLGAAKTNKRFSHDQKVAWGKMGGLKPMVCLKDIQPVEPAMNKKIEKEKEDKLPRSYKKLKELAKLAKLDMLASCPN